jgi:hypothetical protein
MEVNGDNVAGGIEQLEFALDDKISGRDKAAN